MFYSVSKVCLQKHQPFRKWTFTVRKSIRRKRNGISVQTGRTKRGKNGRMDARRNDNCVCEKRSVTGIAQRPDETVGALENTLPGHCCSIAE